ncbi:MAG: S8 family serine peptidase [Thermoanaerobaculia bacterium]
MNRKDLIRSCVTLFLCFSASLVFAQPTGALFHRSPEKVKDEYIILLNDSAVPLSHVRSVAGEMASRARGRVVAIYEHGIPGFAIHATEQQVLGLLHDPRIKMIEEAAVVHLSSPPWHLDRIDQQNLPLDGQPYSYTYDGYGVDVYVLDGGVKNNHSEFYAGQVTSGANYAGLDVPYPPTQYPADDPCGGWYDYYNGGHGTAVASLVAGYSTGVARSARIIPVKFYSGCNNFGVLRNFYTVGAMWGLDWISGQVAASGRRSVVNMSFYFETSDNCTDTQGGTFNCVSSLEYVIMNMLQSNIVMVASANNQAGNNCGTQSPARLGYGGIFTNPNDPDQNLVITVGGTNESDQLYRCASCGPRDAGSNVGPCVSIYAPAYTIHGAHIASSTAYRDDPQWLHPLETVELVSSGTSFAAPLVTGAAARYLQQFPSSSPRMIWTKIYNSAHALPANFDNDGVPANDRLLFMPYFN